MHGLSNEFYIKQWLSKDKEMKQVSISSEFSELDWTTKPACVGAVLLLVQWGSLNRKSGNHLLQNSLQLHSNSTLLRKRELWAFAPWGRGWDPVSQYLVEQSCYYNVRQKFSDITTSSLFFSLFAFTLKKKYPLIQLSFWKTPISSAQREERLN